MHNGMGIPLGAGNRARFAEDARQAEMTFQQRTPVRAGHRYWAHGPLAPGGIRIPGASAISGARGIAGRTDTAQRPRIAFEVATLRARAG